MSLPAMMREGLEYMVEMMTPDEPNAVRIRFSGGEENKVGEMVGQTREEEPVVVVLGTRRETLELLRGGGFTKAAHHNAVTLEMIFEAGDILETAGMTFEVKEVNVVQTDKPFAYVATLEKVGEDD